VGWLLRSGVKTNERSGRAERLERRLPEARFPGGVAAPTVVVLVVLVLLVGLTAFLLRNPRDPGPPAAAVDVEQRLADAVGGAIGTSAAEFAGDLRTLGSGNVGLEQGLPRVLDSHPSWTGVAVLDGNRRTSAAAGRPHGQRGTPRHPAHRARSHRHRR
jgi:hypothetical protein